jgi:hypothetical protein
MHGTWPIHLTVHNLITLIVFGEQYKLWWEIWGSSGNLYKLCSSSLPKVMLNIYNPSRWYNDQTVLLQLDAWIIINHNLSPERYISRRGSLCIKCKDCILSNFSSYKCHHFKFCFDMGVLIWLDICHFCSTMWHQCQ